MVFVFQMIFLVLMLIDMLDPKFRVGQNDNPDDSFLGNFIPSNASVLTHVIQAASFVTYCIFSDASLSDSVKAMELFPRLDGQRGNSENDPIYPQLRQQKSRQMAVS